MNALTHSVEEINKHNVPQFGGQFRRQSTTVDDPYIYSDKFEKSSYCFKETQDSSDDLNFLLVPSVTNGNLTMFSSQQKTKSEHLPILSNNSSIEHNFRPHFPASSNRMPHKKSKMKKNKALSSHFLF